MITGHTMKDIAQLTRRAKQEVKDFMVKNWDKMKDKDENWAKELIDAICEDNLETVKKLFE